MRQKDIWRVQDALAVGASADADSAINAVLRGLVADAEINANIAHWEMLPARPARYADSPAHLDPRLGEVLARRGIHRLYTHQVAAVEHVRDGRHVVVVTPTASGKTLCYNLPVLDAILRDPEARALYLFPTKALAQDQVQRAAAPRSTRLGADIKTHTYDGDTPADARQLIRAAGHIVVTNPDMLHTGILPHHTKWVQAVREPALRRHRRAAPVPRRLRQPRRQRHPPAAPHLRVLRLRTRSSSAARPPSPTPPSWPRASSATTVALVRRQRRAAPAPSVVDLLQPAGRQPRSSASARSSVLEARRLASRFLARGVQTIVFAPQPRPPSRCC